MLFTVYFAVAAWLASIGYLLAAWIWLGTALGVESGRRSDHPVWIMTICGLVLGLLVGCAVTVTWWFMFGYSEAVSQVMGTTKTFGSSMDAVLLGLLGILWLTVLVISSWLIAAIQRGRKESKVLKLKDEFLRAIENES